MQGGEKSVKENIISVRNGRVDTVEDAQSRDIRRVADTQVLSSAVIASRTWVFPPPSANTQQATTADETACMLHGIVAKHVARGMRPTCNEPFSKSKE